MKRIAAWFMSALLLALSLTGCSAGKTETENRGKSYFTYFDTVSFVYSYAGDSAEQFDRRSAGASGILGEYHRLFDIYHEYSGENNLCTLNRNAGGESIEVDRKLIDFLVYAKELYETTDGKMNVMMGSVLSIWHDLRTAAGDDPASARIPTDEELQTAGEHTDISSLEIDEENCTVRISDPDASIDVGALGKGYATEMAARWLEADGALGYVLNVGGNIRIVGTKPDGSGWVTGVKDPANTEKFAVKLMLADTSCVTSGSYERYYTVDGVCYHHIIDEATLFPADYYSSLTVVIKDSALADALSTALFCMPYEDGAALAESLGAEVLWIFPDGEIRYTPGMEKLIAN